MFQIFDKATFSPTPRPETFNLMLENFKIKFWSQTTGSWASLEGPDDFIKMIKLHQKSIIRLSLLKETQLCQIKNQFPSILNQKVIVASIQSFDY